MLTGLPATVLLAEFLPLAGIEAAIRLVILAQRFAVLGRHRLEPLVALLERPLLVLRELLVAAIVLPGSPLLVRTQLMPRTRLLRPHDGCREHRRQERDDAEALHPFDCSSPSSSVVVRMVSKCSSFSMFRRSGRSTKSSGAAASSGGGSAGTVAVACGPPRSRLATSGGLSFVGACATTRRPPSPGRGASGRSPDPRISPTATVATTAVANPNAGRRRRIHHARVAARSASAAASRRTRRKVACSRRPGTSDDVARPPTPWSTAAVVAIS